MSHLKDLLPSWYEGIVETDILMNVEQELFDDLALQIKTAQNNQYISTADSKTIAIYELMLGIISDPSDPLELRRFRVLARLTTQKPYTMRYLQEVLSSFDDPAELTMFYNEYRLLVKMDFEKIGQVSEIEYIFRTVVPANVLVDARNEMKAKLPVDQLYLAAGLTITQFVTMSQDVRQVASARAQIYQPVGMTVAVLEQTSQDLNSSLGLQSNPKSANAITNYQRVEITERRE